MILALDVSSSVIGVALMEEDGTLVDCFPIVLSKQKNLFMKSLIAKISLTGHSVTHIAIEEPLKRFIGGGSSAGVLALLNTWNGMISQLVFEEYNIIPTYFHVSTARKLALPWLKFPKGSDRKELCRVEIAKLYPEIEWPLKKLGKNKGKIHPTALDMSDAMVIALAQINSK